MKRRYVRPLLAALAGFGIAILAVRVAAIQISPTGPLAASLAPGHPAAVQRRAMDALRTEQGLIDPRTEAAAIQSASGAPLDERPYVVAAVRALKANDETAGQALLEEARRLNPRERLVRLLLIDRYLRANEIALAGTEMAAINRLLPATGDAITRELARMVTQRDTRAPAIATLASNPGLFNGVLAHLARTGADPAAIDRIAGDRAPRDATVGNWQNVLIASLIERGRYADARRHWVRTFAVTAEQAAAPLFDPAFARLAGPPFGWAFESSEVGSIEARDGRLDVGFFGRRTGQLASQLLVLPPGTYQLGYAIEGSDGGEPGSLVVAIECAAPARPLVSLPSPKLGAAIQRVRIQFTVPASGCPAQWLRIGGVAREFASPTNASISGLTLVRA